jgi:hypothetical protein
VTAEVSGWSGKGKQIFADRLVGLLLSKAVADLVDGGGRLVGAEGCAQIAIVGDVLLGVEGVPTATFAKAPRDERDVFETVELNRATLEATRSDVVRRRGRISAGADAVSRSGWEARYSKPEKLIERAS